MLSHFYHVWLFATLWTVTRQGPLSMVILQARILESEVAQSCLTLCDPVDCSPPGSSIHEILQARILEWVAISFSRGSSQPRDRTQVFRIAGRRFNLWATRGWFCIGLILSGPMTLVPSDMIRPRYLTDCWQRILEWIAISFSRGSSHPRDRTRVSCIAGRRFNLWATFIYVYTHICYMYIHTYILYVYTRIYMYVSSVQFSHSVMSDSLWPRGL